MASFDLSGTSVSGALPASWLNFASLISVDVSGTLLRCPLTLSSAGELNCSLPAWVGITGYSNEVLAIGSSGAVVAGLHCPILSINEQSRSSLALDDAYHARTLCKCAAPYFGVAGQCQPCPTSCTCDGALIRDCYPVVQPGVISSSSSSSSSVSESSVDSAAYALVSPPAIGMHFLPCTRLPNGNSLCNPRGQPWPHFFVTEDASSATVDLSVWCADGHTSRLCSQCSDGYFASGLLCKRCLPTPLHVLILVGNLALLVAIVVYLYLQQPRVDRAQLTLLAYFSPAGRSGGSSSGSGGSNELHDSNSSQLRTPACTSSTTLLHANACLHETASLAVSIDGGSSADAAPIEPTIAVQSTSSSPLKLLLFHSQQASLLLFSASKLLSSLGGLLFVSAAVSNSFSQLACGTGVYQQLDAGDALLARRGVTAAHRRSGWSSTRRICSRLCVTRPCDDSSLRCVHRLSLPAGVSLCAGSTVSPRLHRQTRGRHCRSASLSQPAALHTVR